MRLSMARLESSIPICEPLIAANLARALQDVFRHSKKHVRVRLITHQHPFLARPGNLVREFDLAGCFLEPFGNVAGEYLKGCHFLSLKLVMVR